MSPGDETAVDDDEGKAKKAQKLTGEMMRKLGLNDPKRMVDEHEEGSEARRERPRERRPVARARG